MGRYQTSILIVDDHVENLLALSAALEPLGQRIVTASSGDEALKRLLDTDFAVILLDVQMPGMDGFEAARLIRRRRRTRFVPIIFLTAFSSDTEQIFRGYEAGAVDYILKPLDPHVLRSKVSVFVELYRLQSETARQAELLQERKIADLARAHDENLQFLTDVLPEFVWRLDARGNAQFLSRSAARFVGTSLEELLATGIWPHVHPEDVDQAMSQWRAGVASTSPFEIELRVRRSDGAYRWHVMRGNPQLDDHGEVAGWIGTTIDIDDRKSDELARERRHEAEQRARAAADERARHARLLADLSQTFAPERDIVSILDQVLRACIPEFADFGSVEALRPDGRIELLALVHSDPEREPVLRAARERFGLGPEADFGVATLIRSGKPFYRRQLASFQAKVRDKVSPELTGSWDELAPISCICIPLFGRSGVLGLLMLCTADSSGRELDDDTFILFKEVGRRTSLLLENTQLYDEQRRVARTLQMNVLSGTGASVPGLTTAAYYQAAAREMEIGGDWYDMLALPDGSMALAVGDIVGRGLGAAAVMAQLRSAMRALSLVCGSPAELVTQLDAYASITQGASYSTVAYGVLDPRTRQLRFACAGHPPPLLVPPDGPARYLEGGRSTPLGLSRGARSEAVVEVAEGSVVILYSDGLVDRRYESLDDGLERLRKTAEQVRSRTLLEYADSVVEQTVGADEIEDDVALLCVRTEPSRSAVFSHRFSARSDQLAHNRAELRSWMASQGVTGETAYDVLLACGEACMNAIDHAYRDQVGGEVAMELRRIGDCVYVAVRDFGHWRRPAVPGMRGRGLTVMYACMDAVEVKMLPTGTMVYMEKRLT